MADAEMTWERFPEMVLAGGGRDAAVADTRALRAGDADAAFRVASLALYVAVVSPEPLVDIYDGLCEGWLGVAPDGPAVAAPGAPGAVSDELWAGLRDLVFDPEAGSDPADITVRTAALTEHLPPEFQARVAAMALRYPGVAEAAATGVPPRFTVDDLARCPADSLGGAMHSFVVDNGFDLEVLDRDALGLADLPYPLDYLNVRILQCHDIWHLVADHKTSGLHEVSVSGFQMAQFGHQYSSMFLGMVLAKVAFTQPDAFAFTLDTILTGYRHGRETPPLMGVEWETVWDRPIAELRVTLGVTAYESPYPAWILEELKGVPARTA
ncbi:MAG TPA: Coq4 family protein [Acidimicrobiales bacterium]